MNSEVGTALAWLAQEKSRWLGYAETTPGRDVVLGLLLTFEKETGIGL